MKLCVTEPDFWEKFFCSKNWKNGPKMGQKHGFLNILRNFVITFYWICSIMKIYSICCVPAQIPYLGKFWFLIYWQKCSQPIRLLDFLINNISKTNQSNSLTFCMMIQIHINLKLTKKNVWIGMVRNGCDQSVHKTLKLARSQKWIDRMKWCFAGWCRSRKARSHFTDFWVGLVKNRCNQLVRETLKSAEWVYELSSFFACCLWCSNFWKDKHCTLWLWNVSLLQLYLLDPQQ